MKPMGRLGLAVGGALLSALLVGMFAMSLSAASRSAYKKAVAAQGKTARVWIAAQDIPADNAIQESMVTSREWPEMIVPADAVTNPKDLINVKVAQPIYAGEPIIKRRLANEGRRIGLPIPEGMVAASIPTNEVMAVGGDVYPGSRVRLVLPVSKSPIADDVLVLSTSKAVSAGEGGLTWVTLALAPDDVVRVLAAADEGGLHVVLLKTNESVEATAPADE